MRLVSKMGMIVWLSMVVIPSLSGCLLAQTTKNEGAPKKIEGKDEAMTLKAGPEIS